MKSAQSARPASPAPRPLPERVVPWICGAGAAVCLLAALSYLAIDAGVPPGRRPWLVGMCLAGAVIIAGCGWAMRRSLQRAAALVAGWSGAALVCALALTLGEGVHSNVMGFFGLLICTLSWAAGFRAGLGITVGCAAALGGLAWAEVAGWLPGAGLPRQDPLALHLATQALLLGFSFALGTLITRQRNRYVEDAAEHEQRLRRVLHLAPEWYWEMDAGFRINHVSQASVGSPDVAARTRVGVPPWQVAGFGLDDAAMDGLRADLQARRSFSNLLLKQHDSHGRRRYARISGEPRYDAQGVFAGYVGVGRDATREVTARRAVAASETRYRELFERTPSPLVLHRWGKVIDANTAAQQLFASPRPNGLAGSDMLSHFDGDSRERLHRLVHEMEARPVGGSHAEVELTLRTGRGERRTVRHSSVRVQTAGGRASLAIFFDDTERRAADLALQRSEALLSLVVETSPDAMVLVDAESGRLLRVNPSFTRYSGYGADEAVGRTTVELQLWRRPGDRVRVLRALRRDQRPPALHLGFVDRHGQPHAMLLSVAAFALDGRRYVVGTVRDVTEVERLRREYEAMLRYAAVGIAFTRERRFVQTNLAWERMFGWPAGSLAGEPQVLTWPSAEAYAETVAEAGALLLRGEPYDTERPMRRRDGSTLLCQLRAQVIDPEHPAESGIIWIAEDVTERRRVEQALASARDAAESANRAKSAFLANTSHEIRTPLNGLLGLARLALRPELDEAQRLQYLRQILDSANNLSGIISDILDLSKIEAGKLSFEALPFDLRTMLDALARAYRELAGAHGLALEMQIDDTVPRVVHGDALRVRQILSNYINNALKFTERGGIRIEAGVPSPGVVRFVVDDTGCGMDEATLARLFMPFSQADESTTRRYGGTGLGLSICRQLATLMGGEVGAESRLGEGSRFWVELPLPPAHLGPAPGEAPPLPDRLAGSRVLMVEDHAVNMMIAVETLAQWGIEVTQAGDGLAAVEAVERAEAAGRPFDAVLMDVQMPVMGGHEATRLLRRHHDRERLPIIALTAAALVSEREEAMAAGMNDFLTKPIDPEKLRDALNRAIAASRPD